MSDAYSGKLSDYLDGGLDEAARGEVEHHLLSCAECAATVAELRAVVERARTLEPRPPAEDLWPGIAARIAAGEPEVVPIRRHHRFRELTLPIPQLAAAAFALMLLTGGGVWL